MEMQDILTTVRGKALTVEHVLEHLKAHGVFRNAIYELIELEVIRLEADQRGITIDESDLNAYLDEKRAQLGLNDAAAAAEYCAWLGISYQTWTETVRSELLRSKLRAALVDEGMVDQHFAEHGMQLKNVSVARIVTPTRAAMDTVLARAANGGGDFAALARAHSIETATQNVGGYVGVLRPGMLPREIDDAVFSAQTNDVVGPFQDGGRWYLYKIIETENGELSPELRRQIAENLFENWLTDSTHQARA